MSLNQRRVEEIADAVLYEGYMLYPYRPSSLKNQQRFNFGVLYPRAWCELQDGSDSPFLRAECLLRTSPQARLRIKIRFLHLGQRSIQQCDASGTTHCMDRLEVDDRVWQPWQEGQERAFTFEGLDPADLGDGDAIKFSTPASESAEAIRDSHGIQVGQIVRRWKKISGSLRVSFEKCRENILRLKVQIQNCSEFAVDRRHPDRDTALLHSLVSAHLILSVDQAEFISLLETPPDLEDLARGCSNVGVWPVLAGDDASSMLASPIILYDYPGIAPESAGGLFDSTEIDEILSLRILTLTQQEKAEIRQSDDRARLVLERTENIPDEQFHKLHGALRTYAHTKRMPDE